MLPIHILLVEDNDGDILLIKDAFEDGKILVSLTVIQDGERAIDFLRAGGISGNKEMPDLIILDVNLPKKNGHEVLKIIKSDDQIRHIPVVMLTTSSSEKDIYESYKEHVNCYITKPVDVDTFMDVISKIENFWFSIVKLPDSRKYV